MGDKKEKYLEAEIEVAELDAADVITTSAVIGNGKDDDPDGWTGEGNW